MPHLTHQMDAYRGGSYRGGLVGVAYCKRCSADTPEDLEKECPGEYVRKNIDLGVGKAVDTDRGKD